jgi:hypothetical protein
LPFIHKCILEGRIIVVVGGSGHDGGGGKAIHPTFCCKNYLLLFTLTDGCLKSTEMVEPCHLFLSALGGGIIGLVGGSWHDGGGGKSISSFFLL